MAFEIDVLDIINQIQTFAHKERGSLLGLLGMEAVAYLVWTEVLLKIVPDIAIINEKINFNSFYAIAAIIVLGWLWSRHITIPKNKITIGIAPFGVISTTGKLSGEEQYNLSVETMEHIYSCLHRFRDSLGFTDFIHFEKLPDRVKPNFNDAGKWCHKLNISILVWGNIRVKITNLVTGATEQKLILEPQFTFNKEPANRFYQYFKDQLNHLHHFEIDFDDTKDKSAILLHYIVHVSMLFAGITAAENKQYERSEEIFSKTTNELLKPKNVNNLTLTDILMTIEFFRARNLHLWGNTLWISNNHEEATKKWGGAGNLLLARAKKIDHTLKNTNEESLELLENAYLYGVYLLAKEGKIEEARKKLKELHLHFNDNDEFTLTLAKIYKKISPEKAQELFQKAIANAHNKQILSEAEAELGKFYIEQKNWIKAADVLKTKLQADENRPYEPELLDDSGRRELASAYLAQHRWIKAQEEILTSTVDKVKNKLKRKFQI
ncbi:MAG: hypothetical protein NTZ80_02730 [Patescibacteria group bacterium]|nr:hypothetical protein [Patescibacteria group bacterium]